MELKMNNKIVKNVNVKLGFPLRKICKLHFHERAEKKKNRRGTGTQKSKNNLLLSQHLFLESSRLAYSDRDTFIADPDFFEVPLTGLLTKNYLLNRANEININMTIASS